MFLNENMFSNYTIMNSEINLDEISDDLRILINNVSIETRFWFYERSQMAQSIDFIDEVPRNASGKVLKKVLREPYWKGQDRQVS